MRRVTVSYEAVPGSGDWERIQPDVERHLPLTNLHWKSASRSIRTIQSLALDLQPFSTFKEDAAAPVRLLERPYLHLLFVVCDDNEVYRATVRLQIRYWLDKVVAMQNQEWLIINVTTGRAAGGKFYQRKGSVVDKIRADFNTGKKDRCVQVSQSSPAEDPTAWAEFTKRVKEGIIARFDTNITLYEEDVRKADSQRQLPGWNFCTFFTQKEALADCFEAMNLIEDALIQYDELEASFFATLKDNNMAWFGKIGGLEPGDDALEILSTSNKHYRELIDSNSISVFDFRIYLFARQAALLLALNRIPEVARRGSYFISSFARTLRQNQKTLGRNFLESWTFSACLHVVDECQHAAKVAALDPATLASFTAVKAELLELARKQLDKIGIEAGHLPLAHPFSMSLQEISSDTPPATAATSPDMRPPVTREDLLEAMADRDLFDKLYISLTNRSIKAYQTSRRKRCALKMHASLAALEDHRERFTQAQKLYSHLPAHYVDLRWSKIESSLLAKCTRLQETLGMSKERLLSTLALVRAGIEYGSKVWSLDTLREAGSSMSKEEGNRVLAQRLMDQVYELSGLLLKDFAAIAFPTFSMRLASGRGTTAADEDGVNVSLIIKSLLPCTIKVDEVRLKFSTVDGEQIWFTARGCLLPPGDTEVVLFCPIAVTGQLALELSQVRYSRIIFQYSHRPISPQNLAPDPRFTPHTPSQPIVVFLRDRQALDIYLEVPRAIRLDQDRMAIISIATGRNQVVKVTVRLTIANAEATFFLEAAQIVLGNAGLVADVVEGALIVENVQADSTVKIQLPIQGLLQDTAIDVNIVAEYFTAKRPTTRRTLRRATHYPVALPLAVTVQDFFREDCLLSKFSVTTDGFHALRIRSAILEGDANVVVKACRNPNAPDVTILPLQTANFLFKIQRPSPVTLQTEQPPLQLTLKYRPIQEEFLTLVKSAISSACSSASLEESNQWFLDNLLPAIEAATNLHWFGVSGSLEHLVCDGLVWRGKTSAAFEGETGGVVFACIERVYEALRKVSTKDLPDEWRLLTIPVELPSLSILNVVHVSALGRVEVGTPISAVIKIVPSLSWAQRAPSGPPVALLYEVATVADDWLISGRTSGQFLAEDGVETSIPLTLIALRPGSLFLPSVAVRPLDAAELSCETQNRSAATCVSILPVVASETFSIELDMLEGIRV